MAAMCRLMGCLVMICSALFCSAQTFQLRGGQSLFPGLYAALRYEHPSNSEINLAGGVYLETANKYNLRFRCYGAEIMAQFSSDRENENLFSFKTALGANVQVENEPWVYKDWDIPKRMNYGFVADGACVLNLSDAFSISIFAQQKFLFNKKLGNTHFVFGVGLSYRLSQ